MNDFIFGIIAIFATAGFVLGILSGWLPLIVLALVLAGLFVWRNASSLVPAADSLGDRRPVARGKEFTFRIDFHNLSDAELGGLMAFGGMIKQRFNYEVYGGAPLLGVRGVSIICHGRSTPLAFSHAVKIAERQVRVGLPDLIESALSVDGEKDG